MRLPGCPTRWSRADGRRNDTHLSYAPRSLLSYPGGARPLATHAYDREHWFAAPSDLIRGIGPDDAGVLVMVSGVVGSNTHRKLNPREFRGFALADDLAPLVFVNGTDSRAAQLFTLAHELVHIASGGSAHDDPDLGVRVAEGTELWCNRVAAEFLVPSPELGRVLSPDLPLADACQRVARTFKVSSLVALRRIFEIGRLDWEAYQRAYGDELERAGRLVEARQAQGGNFYNTQPVRVSKRLTRALIASTLEGQTLYRDAFRLLGFR